MIWRISRWIDIQIKNYSLFADVGFNEMLMNLRGHTLWICIIIANKFPKYPIAKADNKCQVPDSRKCKTGQGMCNYLLLLILTLFIFFTSPRLITIQGPVSRSVYEHVYVEKVLFLSSSVTYVAYPLSPVLLCVRTAALARFTDSKSCNI